MENVTFTPGDVVEWDPAFTDNLASVRRSAAGPGPFIVRYAIGSEYKDNQLVFLSDIEGTPILIGGMYACRFRKSFLGLVLRALHDDAKDK